MIVASALEVSPTILSPIINPLLDVIYRLWLVSKLWTNTVAVAFEVCPRIISLLKKLVV